MTDRGGKKDPWGMVNAIIATIGVIVAVVVGLMPHPGEPGVNNAQYVMRLIDGPSPTPSAPGSVSEVPTISCPDSSVPMSTLSAGSGMQMFHAKAARTTVTENRQAQIVLCLTSTKPWKVFVMNNGGPQGWSITSELGNQCYAFPNLHGISVFERNNYQEHVSEMQAVGPGAVLTTNIVAVCNQIIAPNDKFDVATQIFTLPANAITGGSETQNPVAVNFSGNSVPLE
jgi:hypothetical protein